MKEYKPYIGQQILHNHNKNAEGSLTETGGESYYCIEEYDSLPPFLMTIVSSSDLWMYLSSSGGLTAGRQNRNNALFPYETDDKIHLSIAFTGPKTIIRVRENKKMVIWEPFSERNRGIYRTKRELLKNWTGNKIIFRETNYDLKLRFSYSWMSSDELGWIKKNSIENLSDKIQHIEFVDGLQNILPHGITRESQSMMSTLMDAYKTAEWLPSHQMAIYSMSSIPVDRPEPSEALSANIAWLHGLDVKKIFLSADQLEKFRFGDSPETEKRVFGKSTSFFTFSTSKLIPGNLISWYICADIGKESSDIIALQNKLKSTPDITGYIEKTVSHDTARLEELVRMADGKQYTGDKLNDNRHFANVLFNIMRGGIFENDYNVEAEDFFLHLENSCKGICEKNKTLFAEIDGSVSLDKLLNTVKKSGDDDLLRLSLEYLPLSFSRRHGDPSRPWNFFDIKVKKTDGTPLLNYQGNWRDIFQNWEALSFSFPGFLPGMICRFLNASTADGYNPYRITREGFDWEVLNPGDAWAHIGYWGDHQIIYLLKLLDMYEKFFPGKLLENFNIPIFVYANVPYRIKSYADILANPRDTIIFDHKLHAHILKMSNETGSDGKLLYSSGGLVKASFMEKILVSLLTKLSNFVPDAGIWLNTQRPEWNDANNALVGNGTSMVTLYHMRRFVDFLIKINKTGAVENFMLSEEVSGFLKDIEVILNNHKQSLIEEFTPAKRKKITDQLGKAGESYRKRVYAGFTGSNEELNRSDLQNFLKLVLSYIDRSIGAGRMSSGLYHSYNLLEFSNEELQVKPLQLMLEGQTSILSSGTLQPDEILELIESLFKSELYCKKRKSFMLYPFVSLPGFMEKNNIPPSLLNKSGLLKKLIDTGNTSIVRRDVNGGFHFNGNLKNSDILMKALKELQERGYEKEMVDDETKNILAIYEKVFNHKTFTGRSGSFYKYEGLGSIYWHMVSKLLLTLGENIIRFSASRKNDQVVSSLTKHYYKIKSGIGLHKNPADYGAFPVEPYSHTPLMMGAQQPGLTGQVKEDILSRFNELGLIVENGKIRFLPVMLQVSDFKKNGKLQFSFCNTSIVYTKSEKQSLRIYYRDKNYNPLTINSLNLPGNISKDIFMRSGKIEKIIAGINFLNDGNTANVADSPSK